MGANWSDPPPPDSSEDSRKRKVFSRKKRSQMLKGRVHTTEPGASSTRACVTCDQPNEVIPKPRPEVEVVTDTSERLQPSLPSFPEQLDRLVDVEISMKVARNVGRNWKFLGRILGVKDVKLDSIEARYRDLEEMAYQMLLYWKQTRSETATVNVLAQYLKQVQRADLASEILKTTKDLTTTLIAPQRSQIYRTERQLSHESGIWASLKSTLRMMHKRQKIPGIPWLKNWELNLEDYYVDLTIAYKNDKETRPVDLHDVFKPIAGNIVTVPTRILIEGPAGYGKSTLARKLCFDHANRENYVRHFEAVILLSLRGFEGTLEEMITNTLQLKDYNPEQVLDTIKQNQKSIVIILDGFDELHKSKYEHILPLLKGNQLPHATVIVTSRLGYIELGSEESDSLVTNLLHCVDSRILIKGISGENRNRFLQLYLKGYSPEKYVSLITLVENKFHLNATIKESLLECPLFLLLLIIVSEETDMASLNTKTDLYKRLFNFLLRRAKVKEDPTDQTCDFFEFGDNNPPTYVETLNRFGSFVGVALAEGKYSFSEEEILSACGNDRIILNLGILAQNHSKRGRRRVSWYEPVHLSFLEFSFVYHIWISVVRLRENFTFFFPSIILNMLKLMYLSDLVLPFLSGLCTKHLSALVPFLTQNGFGSLNDINLFSDVGDLLTESKLKPRELAKEFLPMIPKDYIIDWPYRVDILEREALMYAAKAREKQRIILKHKCAVDSQDFGTLPLRVTPKNKEWKVSQSWCELSTNQNFVVDATFFKRCKFSLTICEAPLEEQLTWLSNFMIIEGLFTDKPLYIIEYLCPESQLANIFKEVAELIRQEKVVRVTFENWLSGCTPPIQQWKEFILRATHSKHLLDMTLSVRAHPPLFVDLGSAEGKRWRRIELQGNIVPLVESQLGSQNETNTWELNRFIREMPPHIQALCVEPNFVPRCAFIQNEDSCMAHHLIELYITFSNNTSLQPGIIWNYFNNLQILGIGFTEDFNANEQEAVITTIVSIISHCRHLVRLELWRDCTEEFLADLLQHFHKKKRPAIIKQEQHKKAELHLNTLMLSPFVSSKNEVPKSTTVNLVKEVLRSGSLQHFWISRNEYAEGYAKQEIMKLFSPAEGFRCEVTWVSRGENDLWTFLSHFSVFIYKITAK